MKTPTKHTLIGLLAILLVACSIEPEKPPELPPDASRKDIIIWHAKHHFGLKTDIQFSPSDKGPFEYTLIVNYFDALQDYSTPSILRTDFIKKVSAFMGDTAKDDRLKENTKGNH